jgi:outer membrane protein OmpA-like peptidoglycan-associated protein
MLKPATGTTLGSALLCLLLTSGAFAGDPVGVNEVLGGLKGNWPQAEFSVDITGLTHHAAVVKGALQVQYEAASPGYLTYLRVSSHGDILAAQVANSASSSGSLSAVVSEPIGHERAIFLFSKQPLTAALSGDLGDDREHARTLFQKLSQIPGLTMSVRHIEYLVEAPGQTQFGSRSVILQVQTGANTRFPARIEFNFNSDEITDAGKRDLDVFGDAMAWNLNDRKVILEGHTDDIGSAQYNYELSVRRAKAAQRYLMERFHVSERQVEAVGKGMADPISTTDRSLNRRVEFFFGSPRSTEGARP